MDNRGGFGGLSGSPLVLPVYTWATKPAVGQYLGQRITLSDFDDATFEWNGTGWYSEDFTQIQHLVPIPRITITGATEQVLFQQSVPAGFLHLGGVLTPVAMISKSAAVETLTLRFRFGSTGTTADALLFTAAGITASTMTVVGNIHYGFAKVSASVLRLIWQGQASADISLGVLNMDTTNCFLSITGQLSVGAETASLEQAHCLYY